MPKKILAPLLILCTAFFIAGGANASWLDTLKDTATELTDKAADALKEAEPESPTTSDGEGQTKKPATTPAPAAPKAPAQSTVAAPTAPKTVAPTPATPSGNNDTALVKATQEELKRLGYSIGVDGAYGPNTKKQIIAFEQSQSLEPTGDASVELLAKLKETPTPAAEPAATTTTVVPAPKAEEPKAAAEPPTAKEDKPAASGFSDIIEAVVEKNDPDADSGAIFANFALDGSGEIIRTVVYFQNNGGKKFTSINPSRTLPQGNFKAYVKTEKGSYEYDGRCKGICRSSPPKENALASYEDFVTLTKSGGIFEFRIEPNTPSSDPYVGRTFKARVPSLEEQNAALHAEQAEADKITAAKKAEADKLAAAQQAEAEKKAATMAPLSSEGKIVFEGCNNDQIQQQYYSCSCLGREIDRQVDVEATEDVKYQKQVIAGYEAAIQKNNANAKLSPEKKAQSQKYLQGKIEYSNNRIAMLENKSGWDDKMRRSMVQSAALVLYKEPICKIGEGWREKEYSDCLKSSSSKNVKGKSPEEYCSCSADTVANLWTKSEQSYGSKVAVSLPVQARTQCRK